MKLETAAQHNAQLTGAIELPQPMILPTPKVVLDESAVRMLRSIQDSLGFSAAEEVILKWLEGCSVEGVERLAITLDDYLNNRKLAETEDIL